MPQVRKSNRVRVKTPKAQAASEQRALATPPRPAPILPLSFSAKDVILTPSQARTMNKKLPKGYLLVPVHNQHQQTFLPLVPSLSSPTPTPSIPPLALPPVSDSATRKRKLPARTLEVNDASKQPKTDALNHKQLKTDTLNHKQPKTDILNHKQPKTDIPNHVGSVPTRLIDTERIAVLQMRLDLLRQRKTLLEAAGADPAPSTSIPTPTPKRPRTSKKSSRKRPGRKKGTGGRPLRTVLPQPVSTPASPLATPNYPLTPVPIYDDGRRSRRTIKKPRHLISELKADGTRLSEPLRKCRDLLGYMMTREYAHIFSEPVDYVKLDIPTYPKIVTNPMDLGTIKKRLHSGFYNDVDSFAADVRLVWSNAMLFNKPDHPVHLRAKEYSEIFEKRFNKIPKFSSGRSKKDRRSGGKKDTKGGLAAQLEMMKEKMKKMEDVIAGRSGSISAQSRQKNLDKVALSTREKLLLKNDIFKLPSGKLGPVVDIISKANPDTTNHGDDEEIEIDIELLDTPTLRQLQRYVKKSLNAVKKPKKQRRQTKETLLASDSTTPVTPTASHVSSASTPGHPSIFASPSPSHYTPGSTPQRGSGSPPRLDIAPPYSGPPSSAPTGLFPPSEKPTTNGHRSDSSSGSDSGSSDDDSDSSGDENPSKKDGVKLQGNAVGQDITETPMSVKTGLSPVQNAYGDGDPGSYSASENGGTGAEGVEIIETSGEFSNEPTILQSNIEDSHLPIDTNAWSNLTVQTEAASTSSSLSNLWSDFQSKDQEQKEKARHRIEMENRLRLEQERVAEERKRKAEEIRMQTEVEESFMRADQQRLAIEKQKKLEGEMEAERRTREQRIAATAKISASMGFNQDFQELEKELS